MKKALLIATLGLLLTHVDAYGQRSPMKKSEELNKLNFLIGKWKVSGSRTTQTGEIKTHGTVVYEWVLGGVWLQELAEAETPDVNGTVFNLRLITFDPNSGAYVGDVLDNLNSRTYPVRMKWLDEKTLESVIEVEGQSQQWKRFKIINTFTKVSDSEVRVVQKQIVDDGPPKETGSRVMKKTTTR